MAVLNLNGESEFNRVTCSGDDPNTKWLKAWTAKFLIRSPQESSNVKHHANDRRPFLTVFDLAGNCQGDRYDGEAQPPLGSGW